MAKKFNWQKEQQLFATYLDVLCAYQELTTHVEELQGQIKEARRRVTAGKRSIKKSPRVSHDCVQ